MTRAAFRAACPCTRESPHPTVYIAHHNNRYCARKTIVTEGHEMPTSLALGGTPGGEYGGGGEYCGAGVLRHSRSAQKKLMY